jgi:hypothetical protein
MMQDRQVKRLAYPFSEFVPKVPHVQHHLAVLPRQSASRIPEIRHEKLLWQFPVRTHSGEQICKIVVVA